MSTRMGVTGLQEIERKREREREREATCANDKKSPKKDLDTLNIIRTCSKWNYEAAYWAGKADTKHCMLCQQLDDCYDHMWRCPKLKKQREEADAIAAEVKHAEEALREANEKELPENALRATLEQKRKELNDLMEQFAAANLEARSQPRPRQGGQPRAKPASFAQAAGGAAPPPQTGPKPSILGGGGPKPSIL